MTDTAERILRLYKQANMQEGGSFILEAIINMAGSENTSEAIDELIKSGYLLENNYRYFLTKKGFGYIHSELK